MLCPLKLHCCAWLCCVVRLLGKVDLPSCSHSMAYQVWPKRRERIPWCFNMLFGPQQARLKPSPVWLVIYFGDHLCRDTFRPLSPHSAGHAQHTSSLARGIIQVKMADVFFPTSQLANFTQVQTSNASRIELKIAERRCQ